jgi:hypothetical protein
MPVEPILMGIALAATAGLRVFMPFVFVGGMARYANAPVPDMLAWTATDAGFLLLLVATLLEVLSDKIPVVDHLLDSAATFVKPVAGMLLPAALLHDASPMGAWVLGIVAGAPLALGVHATKAGARAGSSVTTLGAANPAMSFLEDALAVVLLVLTALAPIIAVMMVLVLVVLMIRAWRFIRRRLTPRARSPVQ